MGIVITRDDIIAYAEVDYIIHHMNEKYINKIPAKLLEFFSAIKDPEHEVYVNPRLPLQNQNLKKYTLEVIALLHIKYWCEDEERRKMLYEKMIDNQRKLDNQMREKYNIDNMFGLNSATVVSSVDELNDVQDYSKPKNITKYDNMAYNNPDITDYTDIEEDKLSNYLNINKKNNNSENIENGIIEKTSFIRNFINKIKNIFVKK